MTEPARHVFVDASGRRQAWLRRSGWALSAVITAYLVLLVAALVGPPGLSRLTVPGLGGVLPDTGAARLGDAEGGSGTPQDVLEQVPVTPRPTPTATSVSTGPRPTATLGPATGSPTAAATATRPGNRPSTPPGQAVPTADPTASPAPGNKPTAQPTPRGTGKPTRTPRP